MVDLWYSKTCELEKEFRSVNLVMKKKALLATLAAVSVLGLAACSKDSDQTIASMKGQTITVQDFYNEIKSNSTSQSVVRSMIIYDVFDKTYGDKVTDKQVDAKYKEQAKQYGDSFESQLKAAGYTKESFKKTIRQQLALDAGLKAHVKLTDADYKTAWDSFHPEVTAQFIQVSSEDEAKQVIEEAKKEGADFAKIAKDKSIATSNKGKDVKFDSTSSDVPTEVKSAAFALKDGEISAEPIAVTDASTYQTSYYVVKMVKTQAKGNDMDKYKKTLKKIATDNKLNDSTFVTKTIGEELKKANVKIKDKTFADVLSTYIDATKTSSSSKTKSSKSETKESSSSSKEETKESSTSTSESK